MAFMDEKRRFMDQNCYLWMRMALVDASFMGGGGGYSSHGAGYLPVHHAARQKDCRHFYLSATSYMCATSTDKWPECHQLPCLLHQQQVMDPQRVLDLLLNDLHHISILHEGGVT
jgi:hypothetical protein